MYIYQSSNPCVCGSPSTSDPDSGCPDTCNCLQFCNITINALDESAVGPCGEIGTKDLLDEAYEHDTCACGESALTLTVEWWDPALFDSASIVDGVLTWETADVETLDPQYGEVIVKGSCSTIDAYFTVLIGLVDLCAENDCDPDIEFCDICTGDCEPIVPDIILT